MIDWTAGEAKLGLIYRDELGERRLKSGDIYRIPAGSTFYLVNTGEGQRLHAVCCIDRSERLGMGTAFQGQITVDELEEILTTQKDGPIVHLDDSQAKFIKINDKDRLQHLKKLVEFEEEPMEIEKETTWSWRKLLNSVFGLENEKKRREKTGKSPKTCNICKKSPDFRNNYGSMTS